MRTFFVSRHAGAIEWAHRRGIAAEFVAHLDLEIIEPGDLVLGTLPVHLAAQVCARSATYEHLEIDSGQELRGRDLSADDLDRLNAKLVGYSVMRTPAAAFRST